MSKFSQFDKVLPRLSWERVEIKENLEFMVKPSNSQLVFDSTGKYTKNADQHRFYVREKIAHKLSEAIKHLPNGFKLVLIEGYRSLESQEKMWNAEVLRVKTLNLDLEQVEVERRVGLVIARPSRLANHNCGGAIDVTIEDEKGNMLDMGTVPQSIDVKLSAMFSEGISINQSNNRKMLRDVMVAAGFIYYPGEWWHYCYGDRMWAVYTRQSECFYGPVTEKLFK